MEKGQNRSRPRRPSTAAINSPWDPRSSPYLTWSCRVDQHDQCTGGLTYYPEGWEGTKVEIACACELEGCACAEHAAEEGQRLALATETLPQPTSELAREPQLPNTSEEEPVLEAADGRDPVIDRMTWERLRRAASWGRLLPEDFQLVDELHGLYPDWREEW
jgi:hypothetical protein